MKATMKNLLVLTRLEERMQDPQSCRGTSERYCGHPALTTYDLWPGERYHADRLVKLGFLKKTRATAPWYGSQRVTLYWRDDACRANPFPWQGMTNRRMRERLVSGEAVDLSGCERSAAGEYLLGRVSVADLARARNDHEVLRLAERDTAFAGGGTTATRPQRRGSGPSVSTERAGRCGPRTARTSTGIPPSSASGSGRESRRASRSLCPCGSAAR